MIKFNQLKPIIFLLSLSGIGSGIIYSQPYSAVNEIDKESENRIESITNKQLAPDFKLSDAEGNNFQLSDYSGQIVVLTFIQNIDNKRIGHRLMKKNRKWLEALQNEYQDEILMSGIKEMIDIPRMIPKAFIRSTLRKESFRFLIDWEGDVFKKYSLNQLFTLFIIDSDGQIYYELSEEFSDTKFDKLCNEINILMTSMSDKE